MKVIGVTGGVGAGKSEVLGYIAEHWNATVVEADEVGYLVMRPGKACYSSIVDLLNGNRERRSDAGSGTDCKNCI